MATALFLLGFRIGLVRFPGDAGGVVGPEFALNVDAFMSPNQEEQHPNSRQFWVVDSRHQQERWMDGWIDGHL